jgi:NifU-like protein involved in Fe-S cluster formation
MSSSLYKWLLAPSNGPLDYPYNCSASKRSELRCKTNPDKLFIDWVTIKMGIEEGYIKALRYEAFGSPATLASCSYLSAASLGRSVDELLCLDIESILLDLFMFSAKTPEPERIGCKVVSDVIKMALKAHLHDLELCL